MYRRQNTLALTTTPAERLASEAEPAALARVVAGTARTRDWEIVHWIGRMGAVTLDQVRARFRLGRTVAYRRVAACVEGGLIERVALLRGQPALLRATRHGLRYCGLRLGVAQLPPELVGHWICSGGVAVSLEREYGATAVRSEREIRVLEREEGRAIASARLRSADGIERFHLPDLAVSAPSGVIAIEVELTPKSPKRLVRIIKAWRRARWVESVRYYVPAGGTRRGVERAVDRTNAAERVQILPIEGVLDLGVEANGDAR